MPQINDFSQPSAPMHPLQTSQQAPEKFSLKALKSIPLPETIKVIGDWVAEQSQDKKEDIVKQISFTSGVPVTIGEPSDYTRDLLWIIVVGAFAIVLVGTFTILVLGIFYGPGMVTPELVLMMFTSVVGFLAGLFTPSPIANRTKI